MANQERSENKIEQKPSLYERLGGVYSIATVVDDLIDRVMGDARLNANPLVDEAHHRVSPAGFKYYVTEMVCEAAGGPQKYSGRSMRDSHQDLRITAGEWEAFLDDLQQGTRQVRCASGGTGRAESHCRQYPGRHRRVRERFRLTKQCSHFRDQPPSPRLRRARKVGSRKSVSAPVVDVDFVRLR